MKIDRSCTLAAKRLLNALSMAHPTPDSDAGRFRPALTGVLWERHPDEHVTLVGTDGRILLAMEILPEMAEPVLEAAKQHALETGVWPLIGVEKELLNDHWRTLLGEVRTADSYPRWRHLIPTTFSNNMQTKPTFRHEVLIRCVRIAEELGQQWHGPTGWNQPESATIVEWAPPSAINLPAGVLGVVLLAMPVRSSWVEEHTITHIVTSKLSPLGGT